MMSLGRGLPRGFTSITLGLSCCTQSMHLAVKKSRLSGVGIGRYRACRTARGTARTQLRVAALWEEERRLVTADRTTRHTTKGADAGHYTSSFTGFSLQTTCCGSYYDTLSHRQIKQIKKERREEVEGRQVEFAQVQQVSPGAGVGRRPEREPGAPAGVTSRPADPAGRDDVRAIHPDRRGALPVKLRQTGG